MHNQSVLYHFKKNRLNLKKDTGSRYQDNKLSPAELMVVSISWYPD